MRVRITAVATFSWFWLLQDMRRGETSAPDTFGPFDTEMEARSWRALEGSEPWEDTLEGRTFTKVHEKGSPLEWYREADPTKVEGEWGLVRRLTRLDEVQEHEPVPET